MSPPPYAPYPPHRNRAPGKSQWTISETEEIACFERAWAQGWISGSGDVAWGVSANANEVARDVGVSDDGNRVLWWAKFVGKSTPWHGYPADVVGNRMIVRLCRLRAHGWAPAISTR
jgi:hypothetical protein